MTLFELCRNSPRTQRVRKAKGRPQRERGAKARTGLSLREKRPRACAIFVSRGEGAVIPVRVRAVSGVGDRVAFSALRCLFPGMDPDTKVMKLSGTGIGLRR